MHSDSSLDRKLLGLQSDVGLPFTCPCRQGAGRCQAAELTKRITCRHTITRSNRTNDQQPNGPVSRLALLYGVNFADHTSTASLATFAVRRILATTLRSLLFVIFVCEATLHSMRHCEFWRSMHTANAERHSLTSRM